MVGREAFIVQNGYYYVFLFTVYKVMTLFFFFFHPLLSYFSLFCSFLALLFCLIFHYKYILLPVISYLYVNKITVSTHSLYTKNRWLDPIQ